MTEQNCHDWAAAAARELGVPPPPRWLNRASAALRFVSGARDSQLRHRDLESPRVRGM